MSSRRPEIAPRDLVKEARENVEIYRERLDAKLIIGTIAVHHLVDLIEQMADALEAGSDA